MKKALLVHPADNVAVVTEEVAAGEQVEFDREGIPVILTAAELIPVYHKIALQTLQKGEAVVKYGEIIGQAVCIIEKGTHVHCHNTDSFTIS